MSVIDMSIKNRYQNSMKINVPYLSDFEITGPDNEEEVLVSVENVSKKFCKNLKKSMAYGIIDLSKNLLGIKPNYSSIRKDEFWAVKGVSFKLKRGEVVGLIGANGSGKSTLLRLLAGIFPPDKGRIKIKGRVGALIALGAGFHPHMTGRENIYLNGAILGFTRKELKEKFDDIVEFSELEDFIDSPVSTYSSGMRVRLGFSIASQLDPDILLIDEVLSVGDMGFRGKCINAIDRLTSRAAVIFVSHQISEVARLCSRILILKSGELNYQGTDVNLGINKYYSLMGGIKCMTSGNGKASIKYIQIYSDDQAEKSTSSQMISVEYLSDLYIEIFFTLQSDIQNAIMNIAFFTRDMRFAAQIYSNNCNFMITNKKEGIKTRIKIPQLQLNPGVYFISINLVDSKRGELFLRKHAIKSFQVIGKFIGNAPVQLQAEWSYLE